MNAAIAFLLAHPVLLAMLASVLSILSIDIDAYVTHRKEHPGAPYDFVVVGLRLFKGLILPLLATLGAMGYHAATT